MKSKSERKSNENFLQKTKRKLNEKLESNAIQMQ